jgi:hypothetical protein
MTQSWFVCEESGRWTAALRVAFNRSTQVLPWPRLVEVRNLTELANQSNDRRADLVLIEVSVANVAQGLEFARRCKPLDTPFVALLSDPSLWVSLTDLLWEAGAAEVVSSPRELRGLLRLHDRATACPRQAATTSFEQASFADWAWSMLPWQGA